jgi:hypothetical protein
VGGVVLAVLAASVLVPPAVLSLARRPVDYFTFNPWLRRLPAYLASPEVPWREKLAKLPDLALFWFSADSPFGGVDWGFAVDVRDLGRVLLTAVLFGAYFALVAHGRSPAGRAAAGPGGGVAGILATTVGLSTGPCTVMGCGAPVIPVVGLAFAGLSSGTLALLAGLSRVTTLVLLGGLIIAVGYLGWHAGRAPSAAPVLRRVGASR